MKNKFQSLPKPILILAVLLIAVAVIMMGDPPKNACDSQLEVFLASQSGKLTTLKGTVGSLWARTAKYCQQSKTLGGCSEFYQTIKVALRDLQNVSVDCAPFIVSQESVQKILQDSLNLMVKIAWGEKPPDPGPSMFGWHSRAELSLFCGLKKNILRYKVENEWENFVREVIARLPQSSSLSFEDAFGRSLFSVRCESL